MRASAIRSDATELLLSISSGRMTPSICRIRFSKFTRTSCRPVMTMFPFGKICVINAASVTVISSSRSVVPSPEWLEFESKFVSSGFRRPVVASLTASGSCASKACSKPKRRLRFAPSALERVRELSFSKLASSSMLIVTLIMSPISLARWSLKNVMRSGAQRELFWRSKRLGVGIGRLTG